MAASEDERITYRIKAGAPGVLVEAAIVDGEGNFLPSDGETQGELVLRAPWLSEGYYREPEKGAELWAGGWLHTGDVATLDSMGGIDIRDRIKDVIKTGGEWVSSLQLEDLCSRHAGVREVAVVGIADPQWGERPFALLVAREGHVLDARILKEHLKPFVEQGHIEQVGDSEPDRPCYRNSQDQCRQARQEADPPEHPRMAGQQQRFPLHPLTLFFAAIFIGHYVENVPRRLYSGVFLANSSFSAMLPLRCDLPLWSRRARGVGALNHTLEGSSSSTCWL